MERKKAYYWCTCLQMITPIKVRRLIEEAGGPSEVFGQSDEKLVQMGFTAREQRIYHEACAMEKTIEEEYEKLSQSGIRFVTIEDEEYPVLLKEVADRPIGLFGLCSANEKGKATVSGTENRIHRFKRDATEGREP